MTEIADKLVEYRELVAKKFLLEQEIVDKVTDYIYDHFEEPISFFVFLNLGGKYIVIENLSKQFFTKELINGFCKHFKVDYEGCTVENSIDYEGNKSINKITYCFEVRYR